MEIGDHVIRERNGHVGMRILQENQTVPGKQRTSRDGQDAPTNRNNAGGPILIVDDNGLVQPEMGSANGKPIESMTGSTAVEHLQPPVMLVGAMTNEPTTAQTPEVSTRGGVSHGFAEAAKLAATGEGAVKKNGEMGNGKSRNAPELRESDMQKLSFADPVETGTGASGVEEEHLNQMWENRGSDRRLPIDTMSSGNSRGRKEAPKTSNRAKAYIFDDGNRVRKRIRIDVRNDGNRLQIVVVSEDLQTNPSRIIDLIYHNLEGVREKTATNTELIYQISRRDRLHGPHARLSECKLIMRSMQENAQNGIKWQEQ